MCNKSRKIEKTVRFLRKREICRKLKENREKCRKKEGGSAKRPVFRLCKITKNGKNNLVKRDMVIWEEIVYHNDMLFGIVIQSTSYFRRKKKKWQVYR